MHATGAQSQATATAAAATFTTATVVVVVVIAVLLLLLVFLLQVVAAHPISDCWDCELWTASATLSATVSGQEEAAYLHRPHCAPVASPSCSPSTFLCLCSNLTNLHAPENSIQVGEWKVARAALNRLLDMEKLQLNGAGRSTREEGVRGEGREVSWFEVK